MSSSRAKGRRGKLALLILLIAAASIAIVANRARNDVKLRKALLESQSKLVLTRHGKIEYAEWGEGTPILVIHGAGGGFDQGRLLATAIGPANHRWIAISRFGYLRSDRPENGSPSAQAEALADLLAAIKIERIDIVAMSGGVPPAIKFAELYPGKTGRMALLAPAPFTPFAADETKRPMPTWLYSAMLGNDLVYWTLTKTARGALAKAFDARPELIEGIPASENAFVGGLIDGFLPASERLAGVNNEGAAVSPDQNYDLASICNPTLIIHASDDKINPDEIAKALAEQISGARRITFGRGGHLLLGHHREIRDAMQQFLAP